MASSSASMRPLAAAPHVGRPRPAQAPRLGAGPLLPRVAPPSNWCRAMQGGRSSDGGSGQQYSASREVARAGLLVLLKALAATKLYQASALRAVATSVQAIAPVVDLTRGGKSRSPASGSDGDSSSPPPLPYTPPTQMSALAQHLEAQAAAAAQQQQLQQLAPPSSSPLAPATAALEHHDAVQHLEQAWSQQAALPMASSPSHPLPSEPLAAQVSPTLVTPTPALQPEAAAATATFTQPAADHQQYPPHAPPVPTHAPALPPSPEPYPPPAPLPLPQAPSSYVPTQQQTTWHTIMVPDAQAAAELWAEELRHMQTRRQHLADEVAELLAMHQNPNHHLHHPSSSSSSSSSSSAATPTPLASTTTSFNAMGSHDSMSLGSVEGLFVDAGPEFCTLTCQVETEVEVKQAREAIRQQIAALAERCYWVPAGSPLPLSLPGNGGASGDAGGRELHRAWEAASSEVTYLMVRLVVLQQLPAQPKQRPTVRHVKHEVLTHLHDRLAKLAATHTHHHPHHAGSSTASLAQGLVPLPTASSPFLSQDAALWHVDAPALQTISDHHIPL